MANAITSNAKKDKDSIRPGCAAYKAANPSHAVSQSLPAVYIIGIIAITCYSLNTLQIYTNKSNYPNKNEIKWQTR